MPIPRRHSKVKDKFKTKVCTISCGEDKCNGLNRFNEMSLKLSFEDLEGVKFIEMIREIVP